MPLKDPEARRKYRKAYRATTKGREATRAGNTAWRKRNLPHMNKLVKAWKAKKTKAWMREYYYRTTYGVSPETPKVCDACEQPFTEKRKAVVDHNHQTGAIRGWLHHGCNVALGFCLEDPTILRLLANYAEKWRLLS